MLADYKKCELYEDGWTDSMVRKYDTYLKKVQHRKILAAEGRTASTDSQRTKFYNAEFEFTKEVGNKLFDSIEEVQDYVDHLTKLKVWTKNTNATPIIKVEKTTRHIAGCAMPGHLWLNELFGLNEYTVLHELSHCAGHLHHDVGFRQMLHKLVSSRMGVKKAKVWKEVMKRNKIKTRYPSITYMPPEQWLKKYAMMNKARNNIG